ncbi:SMI1 / KNR4 family (SUKH-1) [Terribacillus halophilus]|uniref:SMI1 / KNR4 family (SUKH-1) n=1 Tax=Terribacillus halophilus TaxID=361279 RepID=A0A1G6PZA5_9BACI|nr:SMI1/KNR4 family protein [Terribacillus halophilus]SDC84856.1 SMI1 / KNR4 family (SUKH-1) [Terribacillus halophilus]
MRKDLEWEYADSEIPESIIKQIGLQLGFNLPQDYIECVKINGGASVFPEEFSVGKVERCFGSLFSFDKESSEYIVKKYDIYSIFLPRAVLPIANDPAGNLICLDYNDNESPIVVYWEHENAWELETLIKEEGYTKEGAEERVRENVTYVAKTFTEFLDKLHD